MQIGFYTHVVLPILTSAIIIKLADRFLNTGVLPILNSAMSIKSTEMSLKHMGVLTKVI